MTAGSNSKPGHRAAQRLEATSKQFVPSAVDSVVKEEREGEKMARAETSMNPVRRLVTGHDSNGRAIFLSDTHLTPANPLLSDNSPPPPGSIIPGFTTIAKTSGLPLASLSTPFVDLHGRKIPLTDASGVTCRIVDFPPVPEGEADEVNFMHRTQSVDFGVILEGKIVLVLDDGVQKEMGTGDVVVQRGTVHAWKNVSGRNCRVLFVLVPSEPARNETTGQVLEPTPTPHLVEDEE